MGRESGRRSARLKDLVIAGVAAGVLSACLALPVLLPTGLGVKAANHAFETLPGSLATPALPQRSVILAADGSRLATFYYENRVEVPLAQVAPIMRQAIIAIEDSRFYRHGALDAKSILRALFANLSAGTVVEGGSTLSQQYVKNALAETATTTTARREALEPTAVRKLRELRLAIGLEKHLTKEQILERYLNIAYFGDGAYGVEAAARHYFGVHAVDLSLAQAATLAGIVRAPQTYDPNLHPVRGRTRRDTVLDRMAELKVITPQQAAEVKGRPLGLRITATPNGCVESSAPFFCDYVQREILANRAFGKTAQERRFLLQRGGLQIRTTLEPRMQKAAQHALNRYVPPDNKSGKAAAEVLIRPGTGEITAMALDRRMGDSTKRGTLWVNLAADSDHGSSLGMQAGSTFKVFTLAAALDKGMAFGHKLDAPKSFVPTGFRNCDGDRVGDSGVSLGNAGDGEGGKQFTLVTGTWHSVNTFFLELERKVGLCATYKMATRLGMRRATGQKLEQYPSFTLGFNTVSPLRLAAAYAAFAARGRYCRPIAITSVMGPTGFLPVPRAKCHQAIDEGVADAVSHILRGVLTKGTAKGNELGRPAAGKTGTVDNFSAAWFAGYTPDLASAVWVGDPRGGYKHPLRDVCLGEACYAQVYGADVPAPIWRATMEAALKGVPAHDFAGPPGEYFREGDGEKEEDDKAKDKAAGADQGGKDLPEPNSRLPWFFDPPFVWPWKGD
ncbi:transglycosylase domain-containing protein [Actinoallomurus rhizosphaericola]|uniref:transglycosylase domain-containing protein n=1 Tax=Actinoallomurus rhizosphaericola TaxID=2952536 RepID=UPI002090DB79|nr:transglycosylase domain-containing protein [Actinoallomurus rhizosphaericola]MCO5992775.1 penicillin-binding protein [Actinoallomurus rhizosphaericola]